MSGKKKGSPKKGKYAGQKFEFRNHHFDDEEKARVIAWTEERDTAIEDCIVTVSDEGYKIGFSLDGWSGMYTVSLTQKRDTHPAYNRCVVYSHTAVGRLAQIALYLVTELLENEGYFKGGGKATEDW